MIREFRFREFRELSELREFREFREVSEFSEFRVIDASIDDISLITLNNP